MENIQDIVKSVDTCHLSTSPKKKLLFGLLAQTRLIPPPSDLNFSICLKESEPDRVNKTILK
jgi:hypothetical protein